MSALEGILKDNSVVAKLWSVDKYQKLAQILSGKKKNRESKINFINEIYSF